MKPKILNPNCAKIMVRQFWIRHQFWRIYRQAASGRHQHWQQNTLYLFDISKQYKEFRSAQIECNVGKADFIRRELLDSSGAPISQETGWSKQFVIFNNLIQYFCMHWPTCFYFWYSRCDAKHTWNVFLRWALSVSHWVTDCSKYCTL